VRKSGKQEKQEQNRQAAGIKRYVVFPPRVKFAGGDFHSLVVMICIVTSRREELSRKAVWNWLIGC